MENLEEQKTAKLLNGKVLAEQIKQNVRAHVEKLSEKPCLACIIVGDNKASEIYVRQKKNACDACGINSLILTMPENSKKSAVVSLIKKLNRDRRVSGILLQLPLPEHLKDFTREIVDEISPAKDVDCLTKTNFGQLALGTGVIAPCTATGVMKLLQSTGTDLRGKKACVIGRSDLVGKSSALLLLQADATVTVCHSKTQNLQKETLQADILVCAAGKPKMITRDFVKPGAIVVDVGITRTPNGIVGDVDFENVQEKCAFITPVPGGVGPMTVACLMQNTLTLHNQQIKTRAANLQKI